MSLCFIYSSIFTHVNWIKCNHIKITICTHTLKIRGLLNLWNSIISFYLLNKTVIKRFRVLRNNMAYIASTLDTALKALNSLMNHEFYFEEWVENLTKFKQTIHRLVLFKRFPLRHVLTFRKKFLNSSSSKHTLKITW